MLLRDGPGPVKVWEQLLQRDAFKCHLNSDITYYKPRHRGLGEEWTTSVHSFGRVDGSHPGLGKFFYLKDPKKSREEKSSRIVRA